MKTFRLLFKHFFGCHGQREDTSEKIKAVNTVIIKFTICRNTSGYEHGAGYCTSKMERSLATEGSPSQKTHKRDLVKSTRRMRMVLGKQQQFQNRSHGTAVSTAPGSLISQSTSYCPCLLSCLQQTKPIAPFFLDSSADYVVKHPLVSFFQMYQTSCLSCLRNQIICPFLLSYLQKRSIYSKNESAVSIAVQFKVLL